MSYKLQLLLAITYCKCEKNEQKFDNDGNVDFICLSKLLPTAGEINSYLLC